MVMRLVFTRIILNYYTASAFDQQNLDLCGDSESYNFLQNLFVQIVFFFQCHHMSLMDFVVSPPGCGRSVTDF
jgi:hypothetical protein